VAGLVAPATPQRISRWAVVLVVVLINLPVAHSTWLDWRLDRYGTDAVAVVTGTAALGPDDDLRYGVEFLFGADIDPDRRLPNVSVRVDRSAYDSAVGTDRVQVRVLPDRPSVFEVDGQVRSRLVWVLTGLADAAVAGFAVLLWRFGRRRPEDAVTGRLSDLET